MTARPTSRTRRPTRATPHPDRQAAPEHDFYVLTDELDRRSVQVAMSPLPTAFTLIRDALQGGRRGTPTVVQNAIASCLRARDVTVFAPMLGVSGWPSMLDGVRGPSEPIDEALERLAGTPGTALLETLDADTDVIPTPQWDTVRRDPDRWLHRYVDALHRGWPELEPLWRRSAALLEREKERVDAALERGVAPSQLVNELSSRTSLVEDRLRVSPSDHEPRRLTVDERGVTLIPIIASPRAGTLSTPGYVLEAGAYPLRDVWRAFDGKAPPPASLEALLGPQRTALLERLDYPRVAGELADVLHLTPSGITFHLRSLEAAGLVVRERHGRNVIVHRTSRGTQLLALYELP